LHPRWPLGLGLLVAAWILLQASRELMGAWEGFAVIFNSLGQALRQFARGDAQGALLLSKFISKWGLTTLELILAAAVLVVGLALGGLAIYMQLTGRSPALARRLIEIRSRMRWLFVLLAVMVAFYPSFLLLGTYWGDVIAGAYLRLGLLLSSASLVAACLPFDRQRLTQSASFLFGLVLVSGLFLVAAQLITINNYPFSLTWSEGNRLYEYSIYFGGGRYDYAGELTAIRRASGRYLLWGLPFLIRDTPLWVHRLWNAVLSTLPHLTLGYLLSRWSGLPRKIRWLFALWVFLFLAQGPIYTPLILSAILVVVFVRPGKLLQSLFAATLAGYYASLSRWTWLPAVPAWTVFVLLTDFSLPPPQPGRGRFSGLLSRDALRRLLPIALTALAALGGGLLANPKLFLPHKLSQSTAFSQPLLWYRLFPNATYPEGVLFALALACLPVIVLLVWMIATKRWKINALQALAYSAALLVFLSGGIVASVKIGGGNNLHNLDMFLVSLAILAGLALRNVRLDTSAWPSMMRLALTLAILLPAWAAIRSGSPLKLPPPEVSRKALENIRVQATQASQSGEVLFMDQRQLLTFGLVDGIRLIPEYEKKYMMDRAMAGDGEYFEAFYQDLARHRFALIISDMQFKMIKDSNYAFSEENNAWVKWVSEPLLCYYTPLRTLQNVDVQLLVPNPAVEDCP
jgi:hypothetical protein